jgi:signal transduction histidine kinase
MAWATDWSSKIPRLDLRLRITATIATVCVAIVAIVGVTFYQASEEMEAALVDQLVAEELNFLIQHHRANPNHTPAFGSNVEYYIVKDETDRRALPPFARDLKPGQYEIDIGEGRGDRDVAVHDSEGARYIIVYNIGPYEDREREFRELVIYSLVCVAVLAIGLGYILSGFLTRQLANLAAQVAHLLPGQHYTPLLNDRLDRDVAVLAEALDTYQLKIITVLKREQDFTANVSHELRTPLTMIRTSCDLLTTEPDLSGKASERIGYISQAVMHMCELTEGLLLLAREQDATAVEAVSLLECVHDIVAPLRSEIGRKGLTLHIDIDPAVTLKVSRSALCLVLANLIRNAVRYTEHGYVRVAFEASRLTVSDSGIGIAPDQLPRIFERNFRVIEAQEGFGIGLDIVRRVCEQAGWRVEVASQLAVGSTFALSVPPPVMAGLAASP